MSSIFGMESQAARRRGHDIGAVLCPVKCWHIDTDVLKPQGPLKRMLMVMGVSSDRHNLDQRPDKHAAAMHAPAGSALGHFAVRRESDPAGIFITDAGISTVAINIKQMPMANPKYTMMLSSIIL
jgi:hypothetical protein